MNVRYLSSAWRAYFIVSSKRGHASISVEHPAGGQSLMVPVHPSDAVPDVLPHLEPAFAHYVARWVLGAALTEHAREVCRQAR